MKLNSKLFAAFAFATLLASCSDDLNVGHEFKANQAKLIGSLTMSEDVTRTGMIENDYWNNDIDGYNVVWTEGDKARVFTLDALTYHAYNLVDGAGTQIGTFHAASGTTLTGKKYAVTDASMVYSVSAANEDGEALLTMTIPARYSVTPEMLGSQIYKFPAPFWGEASEEVVGQSEEIDPKTGKPYDLYDLSVNFQALVHYLRVDLADIPVGTKALVLTTHGSETHPTPNSSYPEEQEGFQLFTEKEALAYSSASSLDGMTYQDWMNLYNSEYGWIVGGKSEALSGTLNTILKKKCYLQVDSLNRLVYSDTLRVDLADVMKYTIVNERGERETIDVNEDQVIWIPIIVNTYADLHVIAVTEDSPLSYQWVGTEIAEYKDYYMNRNGKTDLAQKVLTIDEEVNCRELSELIRKASDGIHTIVANVPELDLSSDPAENVIYIEDDVEKNGGSVILNIAKIDDYDFVIREASWLSNGEDNNGVMQYTWKPVVLNRVPKAAERTVTVNLPSDYDEDVTIDTPEADVEISTIDRANSAASFKVLAANTKFVSGHDVEFNDSRVLQNFKKAAVTVKTGVNKLELAKVDPTTYAYTYGDVYIYTGGQEEAEINNLTVTTDKALSIRISDALVQDIYVMPSSQNERFILTTGSSAIKTVSAHPDAPTQLPNLNNLDIQSYWTGAALTENAIDKGYDQKDIFTVAQLASAGEETQNEYLINDLVESMWLGGSDYPWVGPEVDVSVFNFDGNGVPLKNMTLEINDASFIDPHHCCTSCGPARKMNLTENLGLFRSIINDNSVVKNIDLNDVYLKTDAPIDHIGSIVGYVDNEKAEFSNNIIGEVKIDVNGHGVGGMAGAIETGELIANNNRVSGVGDEKYQPLSSGYVISKKSFVGGLIGMAEVDGPVTVSATTILFKDPTATEPTNQIYTEGACAGGVFGGVHAKGAVRIDESNVYVDDMIFAEGLNRNDYLRAEREVMNPQSNPILPFFDNEGQNDPSTGWFFYEMEYGPEYYGSEQNVIAPTAGQIITSCVGGIVGNGESEGAFRILNSRVEVKNQIAGNGDFIGGLAGVVGTYGNANLSENWVKTAKAESVNAGFVGGAAGATYAEGQAAAKYNNVNIKNIEANGGSFAAGLIGALGVEGGNADASFNDITAENEIYAANQAAAGLIGNSNVYGTGYKLIVLDAGINAGTIKSENGYAAGLVAVLQNGQQSQFGKDKNFTWVADNIYPIRAKFDDTKVTCDENQLYIDVDIKELASAYAVGGIVGKNNVEMIVYDQAWQTVNSHRWGCEVNLNVDKFGITKTEDWFATSTDKNKFGTFGNILGYQDAKINYYTANLIIDDALDDKAKQAILYGLHRDQQHTTIVPTQMYWGDTYKSAVGWASNPGLYFVNDSKRAKGDQYDGFNVYKDYYTTGD